MFIATQGPLPNTIEDFWTMCDEYDVEVIVMLCKLKEKNVEKCAKYWDSKNLSHFEIKIIQEQALDKNILLFKCFIELYLENFNL